MHGDCLCRRCHQPPRRHLVLGAESTFAYFEATRQYIDHFGKPLAFYSDYELNIDGICANTAAAKGRVERAQKTLQDRLVKELRLQGISTIDAANAFMPEFVQDYNERFARPPRDAHEAHRPLRDDESLNLIFAWREPRMVTHNLTLHYERKLYLLADTADYRRLIGRYIDIYQYPIGKIEIRARGQSLPYSTYDKLGEIDHGAIVDSKWLGAVLQVAQITQANRDSRAASVPSSAHRGNGAHIPRTRRPGTKTQRELGPVDLKKAIEKRASLAS